MWVLTLMLLGGRPASAAGRDILFWAPYAPGSPEQAAGALDEFARYVETSAGWPEGTVTAIYRNSEEGGLAALEELDPGFVLVPIPVHLRYHESLDWTPVRGTVLAGVDAQRYTLFGPAGSSLEQFAEFRIEGDAAYDPVFVETLVLGGKQLADDRFVATSRPLSAVRRATRGEKVAVLLDEGQRRALASLPAAADLVLLAESTWMPAALLSRRARSDDEDARALAEVLDRIGDDPDAAELLATLRIQRFEAVEPEALEKIQKTYKAASDR
ncbi:MAG: hypothetical protein ACYTDX_06500 [Planctomycetota bacterium]